MLYPNLTVTGENNYLFRKLHLPYVLKDEMTGLPLSKGAKKIVVLIHGWNPESDNDSYDDPVDDKEFYGLKESLKGALQGTDWSLVLYHWEADSDTGLALWKYLSSTHVVPDPEAALAGTRAAEIGHQHGWNLGERLSSLLTDTDDRKLVHFIAHSAGSWTARAAAKYLVQKKAVAAQVTLLDPFIPGVFEVRALTAFRNTSLTRDKMDELVNFTGRGFIWQAENYYTDDGPFVPGTQETFAWGDRGVNLEVGSNTATHSFWAYDAVHSGPIEFLNDTVRISLGQSALHPAAMANFEASLGFIGWQRSMFRREPIFTGLLGERPTMSPSSFVTEGFDVVVSAQAITRVGGVEISYELLRNGQKVSGTSLETSANGSVSWRLPHVTTADAGQYSVRATTYGFLTNESLPLTLAVAGETPSLSISSVEPRTLNTKPLGERQWITLTGTGFTPSSTLSFSDGSQSYASNATYLEYVSPTEIRYNIAVGPTPANWIVQVLNGGATASPYTFYVVPSAATLAGLSIVGPSTLKAGTAGQFTATAYFSNGSTTPVSATWSVVSGGSAASINASTGALTTTVGANATVEVGASYTSGGITKTATATVAVVATGTVGAGETKELIVNGDFAGGTTGWSTTGNFQADARFTTAHSSPGYAYMSKTDGSAGNDLTGTLTQMVQIPANATSAKLTYWYRITTQESSTANNDYLFLRVLDAGGNVATILDTRTNTHASSAYVERTFPLNAYQGQTIGVSFSGSTNGTAPTTFRVDDVSLQVNLPPAVSLASLAISGPSSLLEGGQGDYLATAIFSDGSTATAPATWSINSGGDVAAINAATGRLSTGNVSVDTVVRVGASYTSGGITCTASSDVTVVNVTAPANAAPQAPANVLPAAGAIGQSLTPSLQADAFSDADGDTHAASWWQVLNDAGTTVVWESGEDAANKTALSVPSGMLTYATAYRWQVRYKDSRGAWSAYSAATRFITRSDATPEPDDQTDYRWVVRGGSSTDEDVGQGVCLDPVGNVYTTGYFGGSADFGSETLVSRGDRDVFVAKYAAASGRLLWARSAGGMGFDRGFAVAADAQGRVYVAGTTAGDAQFGDAGSATVAVGLFVACYSSEGALLWARHYGNSSAVAHRIAVDGTGMLVVAGTFSGTGDFGGVSLSAAGTTGKDDIFVMRLSATDGSAVWAKSAGGTNDDEAYGLALDAQNRIYVVGMTRSFATIFDQVTISRSSGLFNAFAACYDSAGTVLWAKTYGVAGSNYAKAVVVDAAGALYIAGIYRDTATFGATTQVTKNADFFIVKTDAQGSPTWTREFGSSPGSDGGFFGMDFKDICLGIDEIGNIVVSGLYAGTVTIGSKQITAQGDVDILTTKITPAGDFVWLKTAGTPSPNAAWPSDIAVSPSGAIYQTGRLMATTTFSSLSVTSAGGYKDYFLARMSGPVDPVLTVYAQNGSVSRNPEGADYAVGTQVTLSASPASGHRFGGWSGDVSGNVNPLVVTMDVSKVITAHFLEQASISGAANPGQAGAVYGSGNYDVGSTATLTAIPASGWRFLQWSDGNTNSTRSVTVSSEGATFTATFTAIDATADTAPDAFSFIDVTGAEPSTNHQSNAITVHGINAPATVTISGGSYKVNGGNFTSDLGAVVNGDTVVVQLMSASGYATGTTATLTIGGVAGSYTVTTKPPPREQSIILSDDFNASVVNSNTWNYGGSTVTEASGMMQVLAAVTDQTGWLESKPVAIHSRGLLTISRRVKLHYGNEYAMPRFGIKITSLGEFSIHYANMSYSAGGYLSRYGFFVARNSAWPHSAAGQADVSDAITPLWDAWFDEKLTYDPSTGMLQYFINGALKLSYNVGVLQDSVDPTLTLHINTWGWFTGHEQFFDDLVVTQETPIAAAPNFIAQPFDRSVIAGNDATFEVLVGGDPMPDMRWQMSIDGGIIWMDLAETGFFSGTATKVLAVRNVSSAASGNLFRVIATNTEGSAMSSVAMLTVHASFAGWRAERFSGRELIDPGVSGLDADPDGDGHVNLLEYALGLDPKSPSQTNLPEMSATSVDWVYTYLRPEDRADLVYEVEVSSDLVNWSTIGVTHERLSSVNGMETWRAHYPLTSATVVFFRLKVSLP